MDVLRQEQLKERLGDRFHELDVPLLVEWRDGRREAVLFVVEEETEPRRFERDYPNASGPCWNGSGAPRAERRFAPRSRLEQGSERGQLALARRSIQRSQRGRVALIR